MFKVREGGILTGEYVIYPTSPTATGNGASADSPIVLGVVPYKSWRVVAVGFYCAVNGASTVAEKVHFGVGACDIGASDDDYFGSFTQDATALKQMASGDMFMSPSSHEKFKTPDDPANAGTHTWASGSPDGMNVWQTSQGLLTITKKNVASSTGTVHGWIAIEIGVP